MENYKFAAFVMTYERPKIIVETIKKLKSQIFPPELILVVDNSTSSATKDVFLKNEFQDVVYHQMGYNSGPAGAACYALKELTQLGYEWIYWGDDDNPPRDKNVFADLFIGVETLLQSKIKLGIIGEKGGEFNSITGRIRSLSTPELKLNKYLEVDSIPGGHSMIVNSEVIKAGIVPEEKLFFGFEEFDFCLKAKNKGFKLMIDAAKWFQIRENSNRSQKYQWKHSNLGEDKLLIREYYSTRNLLKIFYTHHLYIPLAILLLKSLAKMLYGFRFGMDYGMKMLLIQKMALRDFFKNSYGELNDDIQIRLFSK